MYQATLFIIQVIYMSVYAFVGLLLRNKSSVHGHVSFKIPWICCNIVEIPDLRELLHTVCFYHETVEVDYVELCEHLLKAILPAKCAYLVSVSIYSDIHQYSNTRNMFYEIGTCS